MLERRLETSLRRLVFPNRAQLKGAFAAGAVAAPFIYLKKDEAREPWHPPHPCNVHSR